MTTERDGWIRIGPGPGHLLHPDTAARVLTLLWERHRDIGAALVGEALSGVQLRPVRRRPGDTGEADTGEAGP